MRSAVEVIGGFFETADKIDCIDDDPAHINICNGLIDALNAAGYKIVAAREYEELKIIETMAEIRGD